jgi:hypothetical protein
MIGGTIVQIVGHKIEVLDEGSLDRRWRKLEHVEEVREGDSIWWESHIGYASRPEIFRDKNVGRCTMADEPTRAEMEN